LGADGMFGTGKRTALCQTTWGAPDLPAVLQHHQFRETLRAVMVRRGGKQAAEACRHREREVCDKPRKMGIYPDSGGGQKGRREKANVKLRAPTHCQKATGKKLRDAKGNPRTMIED